MKQYFNRLSINGLLAVIGAFCTSPLLVACFWYGATVFWVWVILWLVVLFLSGLVNPDWLWPEDDDTPEYR